MARWSEGEGEREIERREAERAGNGLTAVGIETGRVRHYRERRIAYKHWFLVATGLFDTSYASLGLLVFADSIVRANSLLISCAGALGLLGRAVAFVLYQVEFPTKACNAYCMSMSPPRAQHATTLRLQTTVRARLA